MLPLTSAFPSLPYWWRVICCTDVSPKPLQGYFSSDFFQQMFPSPQVCVCCPLHWAETLRRAWHIVVPLSLCGAGSRARDSSDSSAPAWWHFPSATGLPPPLLAGSNLGCTKLLSVLPEMNLCNRCGVCAQKEELISPIIQAARFYFPVELERKARCNSWRTFIKQCFECKAFFFLVPGESRSCNQLL